MPALFDLLYREYCGFRAMRSRKRIAMSAILTAPLVAIAVLATKGQAHSTKLATFTEPALL